MSYGGSIATHVRSNRRPAPKARSLSIGRFGYYGFTVESRKLVVHSSLSYVVFIYFDKVLPNQTSLKNS